jgi:hypothetical protein
MAASWVETTAECPSDGAGERRFMADRRPPGGRSVDPSRHCTGRHINGSVRGYNGHRSTDGQCGNRDGEAFDENPMSEGRQKRRRMASVDLEIETDNFGPHWACPATSPFAFSQM